MCAYRKEVQERERSSKKLQMEVSSLKEEVKILEDQIATQEDVVKKAKPDEAKLEEMNAEVEACRGEFEEAMENSRCGTNPNILIQYIVVLLGFFSK